VRESRENRGVGGLARGRADTPSALRVGDDAMDRQLASIVAFDTAALPDGATILSATLRLRRGLQKGTPFGGLGACRVDVRAGGFSGQTALEAGDFEAASDAAQVASLNAPAADGDWAEGVLDAAGLAVINRTGTTQMRVRFARDDDDDRRPDFVGFRSGDDADAASRPQLVISYR
jgi:hypothetical protein